MRRGRLIQTNANLRFHPSLPAFRRETVDVLIDLAIQAIPAQIVGQVAHECAVRIRVVAVTDKDAGIPGHTPPSLRNRSREAYANLRAKSTRQRLPQTPARLIQGAAGSTKFPAERKNPFVPALGRLSLYRILHGLGPDSHFLR